jgi:hypothetical protein
MPRTYARKSDIGLVPHNVMMEAVQLIKSGMSVRKAATEKGVSKSALSRYVMKVDRAPGAVLCPNYSHSQVFNTEQEKLLEDYLIHCSQMFYGLTPTHVRSLAYEMACKNEVTMPQKWSEAKLAGVDWFNAFIERHPDLSIRTPEATSVARATAFNESNIKAYFDMLEPLVPKFNAGGRIL